MSNPPAFLKNLDFRDSVRKNTPNIQSGDCQGKNKITFLNNALKLCYDKNGASHGSILRKVEQNHFFGNRGGGFKITTLIFGKILEFDEFSTQNHAFFQVT